MCKRTSYLLISSISSSIWCSAIVGAAVASPCSALEIANDNLDEKDGRCWRRGVGTEKEEVREFMVLSLVESYFWSSQIIQSIFRGCCDL
jgi:hypothetical protein